MPNNVNACRVMRPILIGRMFNQKRGARWCSELNLFGRACALGEDSDEELSGTPKARETSTDPKALELEFQTNCDNNVTCQYDFS